jgi:hypothetical protein
MPCTALPMPRCRSSDPPPRSGARRRLGHIPWRQHGSRRRGAPNAAARPRGSAPTAAVRHSAARPQDRFGWQQPETARGLPAEAKLRPYWETGDRAPADRAAGRREPSSTLTEPGNPVAAAPQLFPRGVEGDGAARFGEVRAGPSPLWTSRTTSAAVSVPNWTNR